MPRCSRNDSRRPPTCSCLLEAYRTFPEAAEIGKGCASPNCPVRTLDGITLHQFIEAISGPDGAGGDIDGTAEDSRDIPIFRAVAQRRKRRKSKRELD